MAFLFIYIEKEDIFHLVNKSSTLSLLSKASPSLFFF